MRDISPLCKPNQGLVLIRIAVFLCMVPWIAAPLNAQRYADAKIFASDLGPYDRFGARVDASANRLIVNAPVRTRSYSTRYEGAAYIFWRDPSTDAWVEEARLDPPTVDTRMETYIGWDCAIDGDVAMIGVGFGDQFPSRHVYVYRRNPICRAWKLEAEISPPRGLRGGFGNRLELQGDTAVIGVAHDQSFVERILVYRFQPISGAWEEEAELVADQRGSVFGHSLSLDGDTLLVGASKADGVTTKSGAAYVFERNPHTGEWYPTGTLIAPDGNTDDRFGESVKLYGDIAVIGAPGDDDRGLWSGSAYVFRKDRMHGNWVAETHLLAVDGHLDAAFGTSVTIMDDWVAIGAPYQGLPYSGEGAVYLFEPAPETGNGWRPVQVLTSFQTVDGTWIGHDLDCHAQDLYVGAEYDSELRFHAGAVHEFRHVRFRLVSDRESLFRFQANEVRVLDGLPHHPVWLSFSTSGLRVAVRPEKALDLHRPRMAAPVQFTDAEGAANWTLSPPKAPGLSIWFQARQADRKTNVLPMSIR